MSTLVLWDIDGTLLKSGGLTTAAFNRALREIYELGGDPAKIDYGGKTDPQIALEVLLLHEIAESDALDRLERFHTRYVDLVHAEFEQLCRTVRVLPGADEVIAALAASDVLQSTLTGNLRPTAELKLRAAGLREQLDLEIGAFGSDHRNRDELVAIARERAAARYGKVHDVVVVGDTPRDIACGKAGGARTVAVATGNWSYGQLVEHTPDVVLENLADVPKTVAAILNR
jgi:phosphoglycolate phosphatase